MDGHSGARGVVNSISVQRDGNVLMGGDFMAVNSLPAAFVARVWGCQPSYVESIRRRPENGRTTIMLRLPPGSASRVQYKTNLTDVLWNDLAHTIIAGSDSRTNKVDSSVGSAEQRFYRVQQLP